MEEFIVLYINSSVLCKYCLDVMFTEFVGNMHDKIKILHGKQDYRKAEDRCPFVGKQKEVSYKIFEIK